MIGRLSRAGFGKDFVAAALLPDWWEDDCWSDPGVLPELELRVARFLGIPASRVADPTVPLDVGAYAGAHLRRLRDIDRDRLAPAIHAALKVAGAVVRNLPEDFATPAPPPPDGLEWRQQLSPSGARVALDDILRDLWSRGIPVVAVDALPAPSFQGLAAVVDGRPVIVVGYKHDEPGRVAFLLAHEAGHIAAGDCTEGAPVVDQDDEIRSNDQMEVAADRFATRVLVGSDEVPRIPEEGIGDAKELAKAAVTLERQTGADAGSIIFTWARATGDFAMATMATRALYRATGGRKALRKWFRAHIDLAEAPLSDRELLRSVLPSE